MGEQIRCSQFSRDQYASFRRRVARETAYLGEYLADHPDPPCDMVGGVELEAWLVDAAGHPVPTNDTFLAAMDDPGIVTEMGAYNIEFDGPPAQLGGDGLARVHESLADAWRRASLEADRENLQLVMIGTLPSLTAEHLHLDQMSDAPRYRALNEGILALRDRQAPRVRIAGDVLLDFVNDSIMMEAALTSFQVHLQTDQARMPRVYNAGIVAAGPLVAATCNSPFVFDRPVWRESRIPVFEQVFRLFHGAPRVSLGQGYLGESMLELLEENLADHPVILPQLFDEPVERLHHLRLHNGSIWRWIRPVLDVSGPAPLLRIEHRVIPAGPTVDDCMANAVLTWGLLLWLAYRDIPPEAVLSFETAGANLAAAARDGLDAELSWLDGKRHAARDILREHLPDAREALYRAEFDRHEVDRWLGLLEERFTIGQTGAAWQLAWSEKTGMRGATLTRAYLKNQHGGLPAHRWHH